MQLKFAGYLLLILFLLSIPGCRWFKKRGELISSSPKSKIRYHYIRPGETLWSISQKYHVNLDYLIQINHIKHPDRLKIGTRIIIPNGKYYSSSTKSPSLSSNNHPPHHKTKKRTDKHTSPAKPHFAGDTTLKKYKGKFVFPLLKKGRLVLKFHQDKFLYKEGISYSLTKPSPVRAIYSGMVEYAGSEIDGYGNTIIISHPDDYFSLYAFLGKINVEIGDAVKKGEILGTTGKKSPKDKNYYFHFQLRKGVNSVNPLLYFSEKK